MLKLKSLKQYWDDRAVEWKLDVPLVLSSEELDFQQKQLKPGGSTLVLGATIELCKAARKVSRSVASVDFSQAVIGKLRLEEVDYICQDWFEFFEQNAAQYDNIVTDGGLLCLDFPASWQKMAGYIYSHLKPGGVFSARVYVSTDKLPKTHYENPNLGRFVPSMRHLDNNWMVHPEHEAYKDYDMYYAFPPDSEVQRAFEQLALRDKFIPGYEEGERFVSYAWQKTE